jgi:hypothetical protein
MIINKHNFTIDIFHNIPVSNTPMKSQKIERKWHLLEALKSVNIDGMVLEFGVHKGKTMKHISEFFSKESVWGFDSFEGFPEDWITQYSTNHIIYTKEYFALSEIPEFNANVKLVKGFFNKTLPEWSSNNPGNIKFLHIDCDLYSSTKEIFKILNSQIVPGTIIVFDEMYPWDNFSDYEAWEEGEYKALKEWIEEFDREFVPILRSKYQQCAIKIIK